MFISLRLKFFVFATLLAVTPLVLVGQNLTRLTRDELKSAANEDLTTVARELRTQFDNAYRGRWLSSLLVIRNGIDSPDLDVRQKVALLELGLSELPQVVALQLSLEDADIPILATNEGYAARLQALGADPGTVLRTSRETVRDMRESGQLGRPQVSRLEPTQDWIATLALPLESKIANQAVTLVAMIELSLLVDTVRNHPFAQRGEITVVDPTGTSVLSDQPIALDDRDIVQTVMPLVTARARADAQQAYLRPDGTPMLAAYAFPDWFSWAVITELSEDKAYAVVNEITRQIIIVSLLGFSLASLGALVFARRLTRPILNIGQVAERVGEGDFTAKVEDVRARDEIGDLARRFNQMITDLRERMELMKFVSDGTVSAIQDADETGISRGGERRRVTVLFSDIRSYTEFAERVSPEIVIQVLNTYFEAQSKIVSAHGGDIDKFIGDALVAVFEGEDMEARAAACAVAIVEALVELADTLTDHSLHVGIGIASGDVVVGAMGARDRMDFTVLGSTVNLAARLSGNATADQVLVDTATQTACACLPEIDVHAVEAISLKGYADPVPAFEVRRSLHQKTSGTGQEALSSLSD